VWKAVNRHNCHAGGQWMVKILMSYWTWMWSTKDKHVICYGDRQEVPGYDEDTTLRHISAGTTLCTTSLLPSCSCLSGYGVFWPFDSKRGCPFPLTPPHSSDLTPLDFSFGGCKIYHL
jgi:hypothetical protein